MFYSQLCRSESKSAFAFFFCIIHLFCFCLFKIFAFKLHHILTRCITFSCPLSVRSLILATSALQPRHTGSSAVIPFVPQPGVGPLIPADQMICSSVAAAWPVCRVWCLRFNTKLPPFSLHTSSGARYTSLLDVKMSHFPANVSNSNHSVTLKWFPAHELLSLMGSIVHFKDIFNTGVIGKELE